MRAVGRSVGLLLGLLTGLATATCGDDEDAPGACDAPLASGGEDQPDGVGTAVEVITIESVGGDGSYDRVTSLGKGEGTSCDLPEDQRCVRSPVAVSGPLAPFDEEMSLQLRGPMSLDAIAVYVPSGGAWERVSSWNRCESSDITFLNNLGGELSGEWDACNGNSQSYASPDGSQAAAAPQRFGGELANGVEVTVVTDRACEGEGPDSECGVHRPVSMHGWEGSAAGEKLFAVRLRMPTATASPVGAYDDAPAVWFLNASVVRTAQYGCNCRGAGAEGGCGELDVAEVLMGGRPGHATSTIYSFKGSIGADGTTGGGHYFLRPTEQAATFIVIFNAAGTIQMLRLGPDDFDFGGAIDPSRIDAWNARRDFTMSLPSD